MAAASRVLIFGATGVIGHFITSEIVDAKSDFQRIAIFTSPATVESKAAEIQNLRDDGVEIIIGDVNNDEDVANAYRNIDTVICALRTSSGRSRGIRAYQQSNLHRKVLFPRNNGQYAEHAFRKSTNYTSIFERGCRTMKETSTPSFM